MLYCVPSMCLLFILAFAWGVSVPVASVQSIWPNFLLRLDQLISTIAMTKLNCLEADSFEYRGRCSEIYDI